jgi:hypothetical protein
LGEGSKSLLKQKEKANKIFIKSQEEREIKNREINTGENSNPEK